MHMSDPLISPAVGGALWLVTGGLIAASARRLQSSLDDRKVPLMGVLGAFIFAAQMINFSIPGTGSSGHLGGGLLLAILLGPSAAFLTIASVVTVQALFFADGGLLSLGCNIFNMGFFPCFVAFPLIYRRLVRFFPGSPRRQSATALLAAIVALQLGALAVVLETVLSGRADLPFRAFLLAMQPIHLAIGVVEGVVTAAVVAFVHQARPELLEAAPALACLSPRRFVAVLGVAALLLAGVGSWFASARPDGLEWSVARAAGKTALAAPADPAHTQAAAVQSRTALFADYQLPASAELPPISGAGTSLAGLAGVALTVGLIGAAGFALRPRRAEQ